MDRDFIVRDDNLLTKSQCNQIIQYVKDNNEFVPNKNIEYRGYSAVQLMYDGGSLDDSFDVTELRPLKNAILKLECSYREKYPEVNNVSRRVGSTLGSWEASNIKLKYWKPWEYYSLWHSEHGREIPNRINHFLIYLSDNDSHTEFRRYRNVRTKAGRGIMFPAYFTHTHRGSPCKKGLDRFIVSGYFSFNMGHEQYKDIKERGRCI